MSIRNRRVNPTADPGRLVRGMLGVVAVWLLSTGSGQAAGEDDYLKLIQSEASKVNAPTGAESTPGGPSSEADMGAFEDELKRRYFGTYAFYTKLPRRSQEEIFLEYSQGASIENIRKRIYSHYLHRE